MNNKYKITLELSEKEFLIIARTGYREFRSPRNQVRYLLREKLLQLEALPDRAMIFNPTAPITQETQP